MNARYGILLIFLLIFHGSSISQNYSKIPGLYATRYSLDLHPDYSEQKLYASCELTLVNSSGKPCREIPLLLYRLLHIKSAADKNGNPLKFIQNIVSYEDWKQLQANFITISLQTPIPAGGRETLIIEYEGFILGYVETGMLYVKDRINKEFSIFRPDCKAYPQIGYPSWQSNRAAGPESFDYILKATVPDTLIVANGGELVEKKHHDGKLTFTFRNKKPAWRIDAAVADYGIIQNGVNQIYYFPEDSSGAVKIMDALKRALEFYSRIWGPLNDFKGFSVIEIPDNWGSQADVTSIIQTAAAFRDNRQIRQLYHELSHQWNVKLKDTLSPRWNEGLSTFMEYLTVEKLDSQQVLDKATRRMYMMLNEEFSRHPEYKNTAMINFGKADIQGLSYTAGMIMFHVLYRLVGESEFHKLIGSFYQKYYNEGAATEQFIEHIRNNSETDLNKFIDEWMTGTGYCRYITGNIPVDQIALQYKQ